MSALLMYISCIAVLVLSRNTYFVPFRNKNLFHDKKPNNDVEQIASDYVSLCLRERCFQKRFDTNSGISRLL